MKEKYYSYTYQELEAGKSEKTMVSDIREDLKDQSYKMIQGMVIGSWGDPANQSCQTILDDIVKYAEEFSDITDISIGIMDSSDCEISYILQGNYSEFFKALPNLKSLTIQGTQNLELGEISHKGLEELTIITEGMPKRIIEQIEKAKLPNLKKLVLYLGVYYYGFDGDIETIKSLLRNSKFSNLKYLGLVNSEIENDIAAAVADSDYIGQLQVLDFSGGTLTDRGGEILLKAVCAHSNIQKLDLHYHYLSNKLMDELRKLPIEVELSQKQELAVDGEAHPIKISKKEKIVKSERFSYSYEEWEENGKSAETMVADIMSNKRFHELEEIEIGDWGEAYEESCQAIIDDIIKHAEEFSHVKRLSIGIMEYYDCEISWIIQGNYSQLFQNLPHLKSLTIQGSQELELGEIVHEGLEELEIICGGLPASVIKSIEKAKLPNLKKLVLYLGVENYGFDGDIKTIKSLLKNSDFPNLKYLGLVDSEIQDEVAEAVIESKYMKQVEALALSYGVLTDKGGQALLEAVLKNKNLKFLDLHYHYMSDKMVKKLETLSIQVDVSEQNQEEDEEDCYPMITE